jgi:ABC-2 type transport system ATP-binding protein
MDMVIDVRHLTKHFGSFKALSDLNLSVKQGEVLGFLGPNGAGKSTTIRVLLGLLRADQGDVTLLGGDPWKDVSALHKRLAYVPGDVSLWPSLSGGEAIDLLGSLHGGLDEVRRKELIRRFELDPTKKSRTYSKGNRQKVAVIAALCSDVELFILDEPTSGLDPLMEAVFQEEILKEKEKGRSILLSSHIMSEVEALADRISIIRDGHILQTGTLEEMRRQTRTNIKATLHRTPENIDKQPGVHYVKLKGSHLVCSVETDKLGHFMSVLSGYGIEALVSEPPSLEELFLSHYANSKSED